MVPLSVLDLSPITLGGTAAQALQRSLDLARHAERLGYRRYWLAEHHNMPGIASAATVGRDRPRRRRDLDDPRRLGRDHAAQPRAARDRRAVRHAGVALPGPDRPRPRARARDRPADRPRAPPRASRTPPTRSRRTCMELQAYFHPTVAGPGASRRCRARAWRCRSGSSARASSARSSRPRSACPSPSRRTSRRTSSGEALRLYRSRFRPSASLKQPYAMAAVAVFAADTDAAAARLFTSLQQSFVMLRRGTPGPLPPPVDSMDGRWNACGEGRASTRRSGRRSSGRPRPWGRGSGRLSSARASTS